MSQPLDSSTGFPALSRQERRVSTFAEQDPLKFATSTAAEIASVTSTSEATVARTARKLGFKGTKEMKQACASRVDESRMLGPVIESRLATIPQEEAGPSGPRQTSSAVLTAAADLLLKLKDSLDPDAVEATLDSMQRARRVVIYGLGTAYRVAQYLALELERIGIEALPITGSGHTLADAVPRIRAEDTVLVLAPLRVFADVRNLLEVLGPRVESITIATQDELPESDQAPHLLRLPNTTTGAASESVPAWALCDVLVAELARRRPQHAVNTRNYVQELRERFSPR